MDINMHSADYAITEDQAIEELASMVPIDSQPTMRAMMRKFIGVGRDHGVHHSLSVARATMRFLGNAPAHAVCVGVLAAGGHEAHDTKLTGYMERGRECDEILATHRYGHIVTWIIERIGVSKEATRDYNQPKWTNAKWLEEVSLVTLPAEFTPELLLQIRHCVSCADMLHSTGRECQTRSVEYSIRRITEKLGECPLPELRKRVRMIHVQKHLRMLEWCHLDTPEVCELFAKGTRELIEAYNEWCLGNGGGEDELL
jgi:hypothetical protein